MIKTNCISNNDLYCFGINKKKTMETKRKRKRQIWLHVLVRPPDLRLVTVMRVCVIDSKI